MTANTPTRSNTQDNINSVKIEEQIRFVQELQFRLQAIKAHLKKKDITTKGQGWSALSQALLEHSKLSQYDSDSIINKLREITKELIHCSDKSVFIYNIPEDIDITMVKDGFWSIPLESNQPDPLLPSEETLEPKKESAKVVSVERLTLEKKITLIFRSTKHIKTRHEIAINHSLRDSLEASGLDIDSLIGYKTFNRHSYDFVHLNIKKRTIEFCVDSPSNTTKETIDLSIDNLLKAFNKLEIINEIKRKDLEHATPLVTPLSEIEEEGVSVIELSFVSSDGYITGERCRSKNTDIRDGLFHSGGMESQVGIQAFRVALRWSHRSDNITSNPELLVPGIFSNLHEGGEKQDYIQILSCNTIKTFHHALDKMYTYRA